MTKNILTYELLEAFKAQEHLRATEHDRYREATQQAVSELSELQASYDVLFTESVTNGVDKTKELDAIHSKIAMAKEKQERAIRNEQLAHTAIVKSEINRVDVVEKFHAEFIPEVRAGYVPNTEARLKQARDLLISVIQDAKELEGAYDDVAYEVGEMSKGNHALGLTSEWRMVIHPIKDANIRGQQGTTRAVKKVLDEVSKYTYGQVPHGFEYIAEAPKMKGGK